MTPQHNAHSGEPRAYSYSATSTQAAYSVPLMPSHERVFFPDELDPLLASQEATKDVRRPTTPISELIPPPPPQSSHQTPKQCFELSCVPAYKSASDGGNVFRNPQPPPLLPPPSSLPLPQPPPPPASSSAPALKKVKRKPAPIVIPSVRVLIFIKLGFAFFIPAYSFFITIVHPPNKSIATSFTASVDCEWPR